jgi:hypothetical protein
MIATPAYSGKVDIPYTLSFSNTMHLLQLNNIQVSPLITASGSLLVAERNRIIEAFWQSNCTHLLMVDSDLGWPAQAVLAMLQTEKEFVAGIYPARGEKNIFLFRPIVTKEQTIECEKHLIKMEYIPSGFMLLSRSAIKKMRDKFPELYFEPKNKTAVNSPSAGYCLFNTEVWNGEFWGEDYVFCRRAREAGIDIWVDPLIQFDHAGTIGMLVDVLKESQMKENNSKKLDNNVTDINWENQK